MRAIATAVSTLFAVLAAAAVARADDIHVPGDFGNLQRALTSANPGDRILLDARTFRGSFQVETDGVEIVGQPGTRILGRRHTSRRDERNFGLRVEADGVVVRGISFERRGLKAEGMNTRVEGCRFTGTIPEGRGGTILDVYGAGSVVTGNEVVAAPGLEYALEVRGEACVVTDNRVEGPVEEAGILTAGNGVLVDGNEISLDPVGETDIPRLDLPRGIDSFSVGGTVSANRVRGTGIRVHFADHLVEGNTVEDAPLGVASIFLRGDAGVVRGNRVLRGEDTGVLVVGDANRIEDNSVQDNGCVLGVFGQTRFGHGFISRGTGNVLEDNRAEYCVGEAFRVVGARDTSIVRCTGTGAGTCGLGNWAPSTSVTDSVFTDNGVDVVDGGGFGTFDGNTWETGGPGYVGSGNGATAPDVWDESFGDGTFWD
jgi:hypothetical protein